MLTLFSYRIQMTLCYKLHFVKQFWSDALYCSTWPEGQVYISFCPPSSSFSEILLTQSHTCCTLSCPRVPLKTLHRKPSGKWFRNGSSKQRISVSSACYGCQKHSWSRELWMQLPPEQLKSLLAREEWKGCQWEPYPFWGMKMPFGHAGCRAWCPVLLSVPTRFLITMESHQILADIMYINNSEFSTDYKDLSILLTLIII